MFFFNNISESDKSVFVGIVIVGILFFIVCSLIPGGYKPDPDEKTQREIAKSILRGETTAEDVARNNGYDPGHIGKWINDYTQLAVKYALDCENHVEKIDLLEKDITWFTEVCKKYIGDDWKEKTGFSDHDFGK